MGLGAEKYYLDTVARGFEEYYSGAGESPGLWMGAGCFDLGLSGEVAPDDLRAVLSGLSPQDRSELAVNRVPPERRVAGFDLTFSAPKSVSVLYGLWSDEVSNEVREAHREAALDALGYLESHATYARRGKNGMTTLKTSGFVAAGYTHRTSRNGDPQLHTHVLAANLVHASDGRWSTLYSNRLHQHIRTAGFVYQASLRHGLSCRLGVTFGPVVKGAPEIAGMPEKLLKRYATGGDRLSPRRARRQLAENARARGARDAPAEGPRKVRGHDRLAGALAERVPRTRLRAGGAQCRLLPSTSLT